MACLQAAERGRSDAHLETAEAIAERLDQPFERWCATMTLSTRALLAVDIGRSEELANAAYAIGGDTVPEALAAFGGQLVAIQRVAGRLDELAQMAELMAAAAADNPGLPIFRAVIARTYCDLQRHGEATSVIEADIADGFAQFAYDPTWLPAMATLSEVCVVLGRWEPAQLIYERLRPWHDLVVDVVAGTDGPTALHLGMLATLLERPDEAHEHFVEALDVSLRLESPYWVARTQVEWATMLRRRAGAEQGQRAEELLSGALVAARQYGFKTVEARALALLG